MLKANNIGVIFEKENINTLTESSEFLITLFSGFAQAESESLSKNITWGRQKSYEAGNVTFQYSKMLGYRKGEDGRPEIVPDEAETIRRIYRRYLAGASLGQIKDELERDGVPTAQGVKGWSYQVIRNILANEKYAGDALLQKTYTTDCISKRVRKNQGERPMYYVENSHDAIIPKEVFRRVQTEMARRASKRKVMQRSGKTEQGKYSGKYALSELLVCGECGTPYRRCTWARNGKKRIVWRCISRLEFGTEYCHASPTLDESKLHSAILSAMNRLAADRQEIRDATMDLVQQAKSFCDRSGGQTAQLKQRLRDLTAQQDDLLERVLENMSDKDLTAQLKALATEKESLIAQIKDAQREAEDLEDETQRLDEIQACLTEHAAGFTEYDDALARQVIERITVQDTETILVKIRETDIEIKQQLC
jgi:hypothetical protein